ncbi:hypothetical protein CEXT_579651 [Caerostris extrusa]|uniref:Uncharacterized protein n=1 Tax=Caerostris extrusa TaxID=172846 RepID=A0AAV4Q215_CAEEX|nr:hypothetical protein CEXT_579651 [Caerostris extrusa]
MILIFSNTKDFPSEIFATDTHEILNIYSYSGFDIEGDIKAVFCHHNLKNSLRGNTWIVYTSLSSPWGFKATYEMYLYLHRQKGFYFSSRFEKGFPTSEYTNIHRRYSPML